MMVWMLGLQKAVDSDSSGDLVAVLSEPLPKLRGHQGITAESTLFPNWLGVGGANADEEMGGLQTVLGTHSESMT